MQQKWNNFPWIKYFYWKLNDYKVRKIFEIILKNVNNHTGHTLSIEEKQKMIHALPVNCFVLDHFAFVLLCGNPIGSWLLGGVPKLKLEDEFDAKV